MRLTPKYPISWDFPFLFGLLLALPMVPACATKTVTFVVTGTAKVSTVSPDNLDKDGAFLGETPLTVETSKIMGKIVKISQKGKIPVYWVMPDVSGQNIRTTLSLADAPQPPQGSAPGAITEKSTKEEREFKTQISLVESKDKINRVIRLLLKAYQALASRRLQLAEELASRASAIDPELPGPLVIKGIALMQSGDVAGARATLTNARTLDPEDQDIDKLLQALK